MMSTDERIERFKSYMGHSVEPWVTDELYEMGFFTAPASTTHHGAYEGGLFDHSYNVARFLDELTHNNNLDWERGEHAPKIIGMFHDLCKADAYSKEGERYIYYETPLIKGHGDKSVMLLSQFMALNEEEICCIRYHMGAFTDKDEWNFYTRAIHIYPNVLWTHTADMLATHTWEICTGALYHDYI